MDYLSFEILFVYVIEHMIIHYEEQGEYYSIAHAAVTHSSSWSFYSMLTIAIQACQKHAQRKEALKEMSFAMRPFKHVFRFERRKMSSYHHRQVTVREEEWTLINSNAYHGKELYEISQSSNA